MLPVLIADQCPACLQLFKHTANPTPRNPGKLPITQQQQERSGGQNDGDDNIYPNHRRDDNSTILCIHGKEIHAEEGLSIGVQREQTVSSCDINMTFGVTDHNYESS